MPFFTVNNIPLYFQLRRSVKAKRLQVICKPDYFEIVAPRKISNHALIKFAWEHRFWMVKHLRRSIPEDITTQFQWPKEFVTGETIPYRAKRITLQVKYSSAAQIIFQDNNLIVVLPWQKITCEAVENAVKLTLKKWFLQQTLESVKTSIETFCPQLGRWPSDYRIKQQKTRWGSCSGEDRININWLLMLAPPGVLEYVVAHELCHLFHRNHSKRFWNKVEVCFPEYKQYKTWLRQHGQWLRSPID